MSHKILVIDDDVEFVNDFKKTLEDQNYQALTALNADEGFEKIKSENPDLIVLDNIMPNKKGSELVKQIRKKESLPRKIPIVMVSGRGEMIYSAKKKKFEWQPNNPMVAQRGQLPDFKNADDLAKAFKVDDYVSKPFEFPVLLQVIEETIKKFVVEDKPIIEEDSFGV